MLALDRNADGAINDISELFGSATRAGFDHLSDHDENGDNRIDANDAVFDALRVWVDANGDGKTDPGELKTLDELGIASISIAAKDALSGASTVAVAGGTIAATDTVTMADGSTRIIADVRLDVDQVRTKIITDEGFTVNPEAAALPQLKGYGTIPDLHYAMTMDATLKAMVADLVASADGMTALQMREAFEQCA
jgi:hypothetical protein